MPVLGIDVSCAPSSVAVYDGENILGELTAYGTKKHSVILVPQIERLLSDIGIKIRDIDCIAVAAGPGSYTGVRIGCATAKALAHAAGKPCAAVSTLEALAFNVKHFDGIICPVLDARRERVYTALFSGGDNLTRLCPDRVMPLNELFDELSEELSKELKDKRVLFLGDGVKAYQSKVSESLGKRASFADNALTLNRAACAAAIGHRMLINGETIEYSRLVPNYIGLSQAERERLERQKSENK